MVAPWISVLLAIGGVTLMFIATDVLAIVPKLPFGRKIATLIGASLIVIAYLSAGGAF